MATIPPPLPIRSRLGWLIRALICMGVLLPLAALLFYPVENWRGKRAWEKCKRDLEAKGEVLDWNALIPPPIPDEQNFFKASKMAEWFVGRGTNEFVKRMETQVFYESARSECANVIANVNVVSLSDQIDSENADIILRYDPPILIRDDAASSNSSSQENFVIPLIQFQSVPLLVGIENLARQGQISYRLDPQVVFSDPARPEPVVTLRWQDMTARQALLTMLNSYDLQWIDDPKTGAGLITIKQPKNSHVYVEPGMREQLSKLIEDRVRSQENAFQGPSANTPQGFALLVKPMNSTKSLRVSVRAVKPPNLRDVRAFFPPNVVASGGQTVALRVESAHSGYRVFMNMPSFSATDYLAWSDQFKTDFDSIREALKRPYARMDGDYNKPQSVPIPNWVTVRTVTQTLTQRAQCYLLLGQPEKALDELTFVYNLHRILECRPTGKLMTVVAVMTERESTGYYTETVADGLRLHAWLEPQLVAIQEQLKQVNLLPLLAEAFKSERASFPTLMETTWASVRSRSPGSGRGLWLFPRGWVYQNYAYSLALHLEMISCLDLSNRIVLAREVDRFKSKMADGSMGFLPYTFFAYIGMPNYTGAIQSLARCQAQIDEALVACAIERYHLANSRYPGTLDELSPHFIERLPHDLITGKPLKYRRTENGHFVLYSTGWNATDEGGLAGRKGVASLALVDGDWLWP